MDKNVRFDEYSDYQTTMAFVLTTTVLIANSEDESLAQKVRDKIANLASKHPEGNDDFAAALRLSREMVDFSEGMVVRKQPIDVTLGFNFPPPPKKTP